MEMGHLAISLAVLLISINSICGKRERHSSFCGLKSNKIGHKFKPNNKFANLFDHRNLVETDDCIHHLCFNITNYPSDRVKKIIQNRVDFHNFFGSVIQPYSPPTISSKSLTYDDDNMCPVLTYTVRPQTALNKSSRRVVIANVDDFKQEVTFEVCIPNKKCFMDDHKPPQFETFCKQQYTVIKLVTVSENEELHIESIPIPSSCVCMYKGIQ